jgi:hypothetical protein
MRRWSPILFWAVAGVVLVGCDQTIPVPTPVELAAKQIAYGARGTIQVSWAFIVRADGYLLHYRDDGSGPPYLGKGLWFLKAPSGCGKFDGGEPSKMGTIALDLTFPEAGAMEAGVHEGGVVADARPADLSREGGARDAKARDATPRDTVPSVDAALPGLDGDSPIDIDATWCLDRSDIVADAAQPPVETPAARPVVKLAGAVVGRTYAFVVQAFRRDSKSGFSSEVQITIAKSPKK